MKQFSTVVLGLFLTGITNVFGQAGISNNPSNKQVPLDKTLYEHGYNKDNVGTTKDSPREDIDTVMVTSVMDYFVMPDAYYNKAYFKETDYKATDKTASQFVWTVTNGAATAQTPNTTNTSPWVKVTWGNTVGATTAKMIEKPQGLTTACDGEETTINVWVIAKPAIGFNTVSSAYGAMGCYTDASKADAEYDFPITITTSSSQVEVDYTIERKDLYTDAVTTYRTVTMEKVSGGTLNIEFDDYGEYKVTITKVTDRIARKCDVLGSLTDATKVFTYSVLPQPKAGKAYHVPNNF